MKKRSMCVQTLSVLALTAVGCGSPSSGSTWHHDATVQGASAQAATIQAIAPALEVAGAPMQPSAAGAAGGAPVAGSAAPVMSLRCQADASLPQQTDYATPGPLEVATLDLTFEDTSRPIAQTSTHAAAPSRRLVTTIYYPTQGTRLFGAAPLADGGPFPLVMYSHGYSSTRGEAAAAANRLVSRGYIVVSADFPLSNMLANNGSPDSGDVGNQPGDVSFLIDRVLELSKDPGHVLANAIDPARIGATGVSMGGTTTLLVSLHPKLHDPRISVSMPIAPLSSFLLEGFYHTRPLPLLLLSGDLDAFIDYKTNARRSFELAQPNAHLVTLANGSHAAFAIQFDAGTVALLNGLLGKPGADPSNPDGFGCGAVADTLNAAPNFVDSLGGPEEFIQLDPESPLAPCTGDEYKHPAMDPTKQVEVTAAAVAAYMDAHLAADSERRRDACRYVLHELPKLPGVTVE